MARLRQTLGGRYGGPLTHHSYTTSWGTTECRDAFLGLMRTAAKLGIAFWDYLGDRFSIPGQPNVPYLPDIVRGRGQTA